jgi:hypothetical protein
VNGHVRAAALAAAAAEAEREMRKIPLREVQAQYFDILNQFFGKPFSEMKAHGVTPEQIAGHMASQDRIVRAFQSDLEGFVSGMYEFWGHYAPVVEVHLRDLKCLKSIFGGDFFPLSSGNIACSVGLYMDTIVLPDPLLRVLSMAKVMPPRELFRLLTKHALAALGYRDLALAAVTPPIVVIAADPMFLEPRYLNALQVTSDGDLVKHTSLMFGRNFSGSEELGGFLNQLSTADELVAKLVDPKRFLFDSDWSERPSDQFARHVRDTGSQIPSAVGASVGETVYRAFFGRMMQTNDLLFRSARHAGTPLVDAPTSWQYLLWKYEYDSGPSGRSREEMQEVVISRAIASEGRTEFSMLSGIPAEALIELRLNGAMAQLRETIRSGLTDLDLAPPDSLPKVAEEVIAAIDSSLEKHELELRDVTASRRKFFGLDVSRWIVTGGLSVAAALAHNMGLALLAAATPPILGAPSIPDLRKRWQELQSRSEKLQRSPSAILFRYLGPKFGFPSEG